MDGFYYNISRSIIDQGFNGPKVSNNCHINYVLICKLCGVFITVIMLYYIISSNRIAMTLTYTTNNETTLSLMYNYIPIAAHII